jgi:hypothetical protein
MSKANSFYCPICGRNTRHLEVELREVSAVQGVGKWVQALTESYGGYSIGKRILSVSGTFFWKCVDCTSIYQRDAAGEIMTTIKVGQPNTPPANQSDSEKFIITNNILNVITNVNININVLEPISQKRYPWMHDHDGHYVGRMLDRYTFILDGRSLLFEQRKGLANTLVKQKLLDLGPHAIEQQLSQNKNQIILKDLREDEAVKLYEKFLGSSLIDYIEIK